ncbi:sensor histidine kinase [Arcicella sp. LKC2W]|uniref:sensor histidine kinase n=1 Tax=Arcicella sp. LKC2W TaxID=2984198 RepID=UPI002B1EA016|nr:sensor histidine kinase [Arcicella sp. LKC2W]MEA5460858.1 sensor histidine kinase [Arcicella sp. LKC2W]
MIKKLQDWWNTYYQNHKKGIYFLVTFWTFFILFNAGLYYASIHNWKDVLRVFINFPSWALLVFLPNYLIFRYYFQKRKYLIGLGLIIIDIIVFLFLRYLLNIYLYPLLGVNTSYTNRTFNLSYFVIESAYTFLHNLILAYGYGFAKHAIALEVKERKLIEANAKLQHQKDMTQIAFLQAQINPHFLYNTLNFIYSEAIMVSDSVAESIMTLSNIMRYTLTETGKDTLVSLYSEINHIKNYLKLQKMRFSNELYLDLTIEGEENINHLEILPLVLISFIENIFKHGDIHDPKNPAKIIMIVEENSLFLSIYNRKNKGPKEHTSGVGMNNIRTRMDILYGNKYNVNIFLDTEDEFALEFTISDMEEAFRNLKKYKLINR